VPGSFAVTATGFPSLSSVPLAQAPQPPRDPADGIGMYFTVTGLPASLTASRLSPEGFATGTLTIQGSPTAADAGTRQVRITAQNGVGATTEQLLTLNIVSITAPAPATGATCNGAYNGTFNGTLVVSANQNCVIVGGGVNGNVNGGSLVLQHVTVTGNLQIQGGAAFSIGQGTTVGKNLTIQNLSGAALTNQVCGARVDGNLTLSGNATPLQIGSLDGSCAGNSFRGTVTIQGNTAATKVFNNVMTKQLTCSGNTSITGGGNSAQKFSGQCSGF
jgi:hypothetical protein